MGERVVDCGERGILEGGLGRFCNLCEGGGGLGVGKVLEWRTSARWRNRVPS